MPESSWDNSPPPLCGLVLAGGESLRMGFDKGLIPYHGLPHREYIWHLLQPFTQSAFISCRPGQITGGDIPLIEDIRSDLGPLSGLLSAFHYNASCAWLVVACDFPLLDKSAIAQLVHERDPELYATSFFDARSGLPEPWITIAEPKIYPVLADYLGRGKTSLRGVLQDHPIRLVTPEQPDVLLNANSPGDLRSYEL